MTDYPTPGATAPRSPTLTRLLFGLALGSAAGAAAAAMAPWQIVPLLVFDGTTLVWVVSVWARILRLDALATSAHATSDDPRRATTDAVLLFASIASLAAVLLSILKAANSHGTERFVLVTAAVCTIIVSWSVVHTLFTLRYADLYYTGHDGGVDFNQDDKPTYTDFAYLAFTIGMTYQVSDTQLTTSEIRHTALRHALLSYLFGTVIIATAINVAAGLSK